MTLALPAGLTTVEVTGKYLSPEGSQATGQVSFDIPSPLIDSNDKVVLVPLTIRRQLDATGSFTATLPVTDDTDLTPLNWYYTITERIDRWQSRTWSFQLPASAGPSVDITELTPITPSLEVFGTVTSVDGRHGDVELDDRYAQLGGDGKVLSGQLPATGVASVNGHSGTVILGANDVGALSAGARGAANGVASLDGSGKVPIGQLPANLNQPISFAVYDRTNQTYPSRPSGASLVWWIGPTFPSGSLLHDLYTQTAE
jgi:hypothetical protein